MSEKEFDTNEVLGDKDNCFKCGEDPAVSFKQIQEWEYKDEDKENERIKTHMFICKEHHDLMIQKGEEML